MKEEIIKLNKYCEIRLPSIPNFILMPKNHIKKGYESSIPVAGFAKAELTKIGKEWTKSLIKKAKMRGRSRRIDI